MQVIDTFIWGCEVVKSHALSFDFVLGFLILSALAELSVDGLYLLLIGNQLSSIKIFHLHDCIVDPVLELAVA